MTLSPAGPAPRIGAVTADRASLGRCERVELTVELTTTFDTPYDSQQVTLSASFQAPSGTAWEIPGFWDGRDSWRVRFTPSETGAWRYVVRVRDRRLRTCLGTRPPARRDLHRRSLALGGLSDGAYTVRPFDTWEGHVLAELNIQVAGGEVTIALPAFRNDIALKIVRTS